MRARELACTSLLVCQDREGGVELSFLNGTVAPPIRRGVLAREQAALARETERGVQPVGCWSRGHTHLRARRQRPAALIKYDA